MSYKIQNVKNYPDDGNHQEVVWLGIFMPFDVVKGLDYLPQDNGDYDNYNKTHWWVYARSRRYFDGIQDIATFIPNLPSKEFSTLDEAISFCLEWRKEWLTNELNKEV